MITTTMIMTQYTQVDDQGRNLTSSQRQLLCLARILLVRPTVVNHHHRHHLPHQHQHQHQQHHHFKVVILDEATSSLESENERRVQRLILSTLANSTVITVTHRLVMMIISMLWNMCTILLDHCPSQVGDCANIIK